MRTFWSPDVRFSGAPEPLTELIIFLWSPRGRAEGTLQGEVRIRVRQGFTSSKVFRNKGDVAVDLEPKPAAVRGCGLEGWSSFRPA